jgi:L-amino acid N-acyltransferase YncA
LIRPALASDADAIARIYNHYIGNTTVTVEETQVSAQEMAARIEEFDAASLPWLVMDHETKVVGYAYASK